MRIQNVTKHHFLDVYFFFPTVLLFRRFYFCNFLFYLFLFLQKTR